MAVAGFSWACGFSEAADLSAAVSEAAAAVRAGLAGQTPDLAVVFCSVAFAEEYERFPALVQKELAAKVLIGNSGMGVIGVGREAEERPAVSISAGTLPGVWVAPFHIDSAQLDALGPSPKRWGEFLKAPASETVNFLLFGHPFTIPVDDLVSSLDQAFTSGRKVRGLASGGKSAG